MSWTVIHTAASIGMVLVAIFMLSRWREKYVFPERLGLGLAGGAGLLRINAIWELTQSPFYEWAPTLMIVGVLLFLSGRAWRDWRHEAANWQQTREATARLKARGVI